MKLSITLKNGQVLVYEGTCEELVKVGEECAARIDRDISSDTANSLTTQATEPAPVRANETSRLWTEHTITRLWHSLYGDQAKVVKFLVEKGGKATYEDLGHHMGYNAQRLSGVLSGITRNAQSATNDRNAKLVDWRITEQATQEYFIHRDALPFLRTVMKPPTEAELTDRVSKLLKSQAPRTMTMDMISLSIGHNISPYSRILGPMEANGEIENTSDGVRWKQETFEVVTDAAPSLQ